MSRRTEESNLKPQVIRECEPAELADAGRDGKSGHTILKKKQRVEKKAALRVQSKGRVGARTTRPKRIAKATPETKPIHDSLLPETKAVDEESAPIVNSITVESVIPDAEVEFQEPELLQGTNASVSAETHLALAAAVSREVGYESEIKVAQSSIQETEEPEVDALGKQTEVTTDVEMRPTKEPQGRTVLKWLAGALEWARKHLGYRPVRKRLRVCETVSLGEKRFVAVIEVDGEQFLVGGAASSVATLARLEPSPQFAEVLKRRWAQDPIQA